MERLRERDRRGGKRTSDGVAYAGADGEGEEDRGGGVEEYPGGESEGWDEGSHCCGLVRESVSIPRRILQGLSGRGIEEE